jgi:hypothetical protein
VRYCRVAAFSHPELLDGYACFPPSREVELRLKQYAGDSQSWAAAQDPRGVMFFGNNAGVLEFDGVSWRRWTTANASAVRSLAVGADGRIYVGAQGEIGYLTPAGAGNLRYVSLNEKVPAALRDFADIAKIHAAPEGIYFQALERLFL